MFICVHLWLIPLASAAQIDTAQQCKVLDPELQSTYVGGCVNGLADGQGEATGIARYKGDFKAGRKHGHGVKTWSSGDRYDGDFVEDRKEGNGTYIWGTGSPWAGEKYTGGFIHDRRSGYGVYEWPSGDRYAGTWKDGRITGQPTAGMFTRARAEEERIAAVKVIGTNVCREMTVGIGTPDLIRGTVMSIKGDKVTVRIYDPGQFENTIANTLVTKGSVVWDYPQLWTACKNP